VELPVPSGEYCDSKSKQITTIFFEIANNATFWINLYSSVISENKTPSLDNKTLGRLRLSSLQETSDIASRAT
jgi:hypothetical protein